MSPVILRDLVLLTTVDQDEVQLPGLTLEASEDVVTVLGPARQVLRSWSWSEIAELRVEGAETGGGREVLELWAADRCHRFLVDGPTLTGLLDAGARWRGASEAVGDEAGPVMADHRTRRSGKVKLVRVRRPRHARLLRVRPVPACVGALVLIAGGATFGAIGTGGAQAANRPNAAGGGGVSIMSRMSQEYASRTIAGDLPAATTPPAPAPPSLAGAPALQSHEVFGFAPYWTLPESSGFDVSDLTTIAYFSIGVNGNGSIQNSGPGWTGYQSQDLANLITRAHAAGSRVVLTVTCFGAGALNQLTSDAAAQKALASNLVQLIAAKNLDGVNLDFEGEGSQDQAGLDSVVAQVSAAVKAANAHWQVTMDTYASSAGDPGGFYDIAGLAPSVDAFFVMAYDMNGSTPSPTAALTGSGFTDLDALQEYTAVVPASKVILGVPYYGYDWPTNGPGLGAAATGPKAPLSYSQIASANHPVYWDPATQTAWTSYQVGTQWHQTWFDDPTSLALKAQLAQTFHIAGMGVWALGMDGNNPAMLAALLGNAPVIKDFVPGPSTAGSTAPGGSSTTSTTTAKPTYSYAGVWNQTSVSLTPAVLASLPDDGEGQPAGVLSTFSTDDPAFSCLTKGGTLAVSELIGAPGVFLVTAQTPGNCASGWWTFAADTGPGGGAGGGSGGGGGGTTTTTDPTTTTSTSSTTTTSSSTTTSTTAPPG